MVEYQQIEEEPENYFIARDNETEVGRIYYSWSANGALIINHTEICPEFKGKGMGKKLVFHVVDYARKNKITIVPVCDYAKSLFERTPDIKDVL